MKTLAHTHTGCYRVETLSGTEYFLSYIDRSIIRLPQAGLSDEGLMRKDSESCTFIGVVRCIVGQPMVVLIDLELTPACVTVRTTSNVVSIRRGALDK